jgi:hypothetical protein
LNGDEETLSTEQRLVLQTIYDRFREHGKWPTFIAVDRLLRRQHGMNTRAIFNSVPDSLVVKPRQGMGPTDTDELTLRLPGIEACQGGREDTDRVVRLLRWFAEQEMAFTPPDGSEETMPRVTSEEVAVQLGLDRADPADAAALERLYAMLRLGRWGLGSSGSNEGTWFVELAPDIWRFRDVKSVADVNTVREQWIAEAQAAMPQFRGAAPAAHFHVRVSRRSRPQEDAVRLDLSRDDLESRFLGPRREGRPIVVGGTVIPIDDLAKLRISMSSQPSAALLSQPSVREKIAAGRTFATPAEWLIADLCEDVTDEFITEPPGDVGDHPGMPVSVPVPPPQSVPYVDQEITEAIEAKIGTSTFDLSKLLALIEELNDNYQSEHTYAAHALLRAILDHVPPVLGQPNFATVVNNYSWSRTDKGYLQQLLNCKTQADDALHRQISAKPCVLRFADLPASVCVNRLLQECADKL